MNHHGAEMGRDCGRERDTFGEGEGTKPPTCKARWKARLVFLPMTHRHGDHGRLPEQNMTQIEASDPNNGTGEPSKAFSIASGPDSLEPEFFGRCARGSPRPRPA